MDKSEVILYQPNDAVSVEVRFEGENIWLNRQQMSALFDRDVKTIGKHINNALNEELSEFSTVANFATVGGNDTTNSVVAKFATTATDGKVYQMEYYNLDVILSVGYRVKSSRGIQFRIWANRILKEYLLKGYVTHNQIDVAKLYANHENRITKLEKNVDFFVKTALPPIQGIFSQGQIFDAYVFATDLIKSAKKSVVLIDNYVNEKSLLILSKRNKGVSAEVYTRQITTQLKLDLEKHNSQYEPIKLNKLTTFHDRFVVIDDVVYHIGASLKDLGRDLFAFSKMNIAVSKLLD